MGFWWHFLKSRTENKINTHTKQTNKQQQNLVCISFWSRLTCVQWLENSSKWNRSLGKWKKRFYYTENIWENDPVNIFSELLALVVGYYSVTVKKTKTKSRLWKEWLILTEVSRKGGRQGHLVLEQEAGRLHLHPHKESRKWITSGASALKAHPCDVLPPGRLHPLMVPQPPQTVPPPGELVCKHMRLWRTFLIQITTAVDRADLFKCSFSG